MILLEQFYEDLQEVEHQPFQLIVLFDTPRMNIMKVDTDRKIELGCKTIVIVLEIMKLSIEEFDKNSVNPEGNSLEYFPEYLDSGNFDNNCPFCTAKLLRNENL